jgi:hypothetical protein
MFKGSGITMEEAQKNPENVAAVVWKHARIINVCYLPFISLFFQANYLFSLFFFVQLEFQQRIQEGGGAPPKPPPRTLKRPPQLPQRAPVGGPVATPGKRRVRDREVRREVWW